MLTRGLWVLAVLAFVAIVMVVIAVTAPVFAEHVETTAAKPPEAKVSVEVDAAAVSDVLESLRKQSGKKILCESTAKGQVTCSVSSVPLETALVAMCTAAKLEWRKVYISPDSKLLEQPDKMASSVRLMTGIACPDMLVADGTRGTGIHCTDKNAAKSAEEKLVAELGMQPVYLVTSDSSVGQKPAEAKTSAVTDYIDKSQKLLDDFVKMTPEEQEQAVVAGMMMYENVSPELMSSVLRGVMRTDPEMLKRTQARQHEMLLYMDPQERRQMIRMGMEMQKSMSPELMQMIQEDVRVIMEEDKANAE